MSKVIRYERKDYLLHSVQGMAVRQLITRLQDELELANGGPL